MRIRLGYGPHGQELVTRDEPGRLNDRWTADGKAGGLAWTRRRIEVRSVEDARRILQRSRCDADTLVDFRRVLAFCGVHDFSRRSDDAVLTALATELASGRVLLFRWNPQPVPWRPPVTPAEVAVAPAARPPAETTSAAPAPVESTFEPEVDVAAMVQALQQAAHDGIPFCEECARAGAGA